jgi:hypothetical protein
MKPISKFALAIAASFLASGCAKKEDGPVPPVAAPQAASAPVSTATAAAPAPAATKPGDEPAKAAQAGCGEHAGQAGDANCPFHEANAKVPDPAMGCGDHAVTEPTKSADGKLHFGATFAAPESKPLGQAVAQATDGQELAVRVSGTIEKVCKKKGCWMVVKDGDVQARVVMKDYAFTVPLDSEGRTTSVEGTLKVRVFTEAQAKHLAEDGGEDPSKVTGEKKEFTLTATSVEIGG